MCVPESSRPSSIFHGTQEGISVLWQFPALVRLIASDPAIHCTGFAASNRCSQKRDSGLCLRHVHSSLRSRI